MAMRGPFVLTSKKIDKEITKTSPGAYQLSNLIDSVKYVGRADNDIYVRLKQWLGKYKYFWYSYATSPKDAFEQECNSYHYYGGTQGHLENDKHPQCPEGTTWRCPKCNIFE
jgi:hypothetical protein